MGSVYTFNNAILVKDGAIAASESCCCNLCTCYCEWPINEDQPGIHRQEIIPCNVSPCCFFPFGLANLRRQYINNIGTMPIGVSWKPGYPQAITDCYPKWIIDEAYGVCYFGSNNSCNFIIRRRIRLLAIDCSNLQVVDITEEAAEGIFTSETPSADCTSGPDIPSFFDDPVPSCCPCPRIQANTIPADQQCNSYAGSYPVAGFIYCCPEGSYAVDPLKNPGFCCSSSDPCPE